jgi:hypothetical protein
MLLQHLEDARAVLSALKGSLVGVGMTAYSRILPSYFCSPYRIISARQTGDLPFLRKEAEIFCLEEELGRPLGDPYFESARLLSHPLVRGYLKGLPDPKYLYLYQSYPELEELARAEKWILIANPSGLRIETGSRAFFDSLVGTLGLNRVPGAILPLEELFSNEYGYWAESVGAAFALQLPEIRQGGGRGTFFVRSEMEFKKVRERLEEGCWRGAKLKTVSLRRLIEGTPASVALCVTGKGVLSSRIQVQMIDLPYCRGMAERGVFCGHSWGGAFWPDPVWEEVRSQTLPIGEYLRRKGYRGILGIDFVIEKGIGRVYPLEINPRLTGAFPMLSQLHLGGRVIPLEVFHILELAGIPYELNLPAQNERYDSEQVGGHLLLFEMGGGRTLRTPFLRGGLYEMEEGGGCFYRRPAMDYRDIQNAGEFIVIDGPPGADIGPGDDFYRLCRLLFRQPLWGEEERTLNSALRAAEWVYRQIIAEESHG